MKMNNNMNVCTAIPHIRIKQNDDTGYVRLNNLDAWDLDFVKIPSACDKQICNPNVYISGDPRLKSMAHCDGTMALDNLPRNGKVQIGDAERLPRNQGRSVHDSYNTIHNGDVTYYYGKDLSVPFISTLFIQPGLVVRDEYVDPMGTLKPHFYRASLDNKNCLSWIRDSQFHREDLMARQIWKRNQSKYSVTTNNR